jgi:two-component system, cell cycle response regulator
MTGKDNLAHRVLIADDDPVSRRMLQALLQKWGFEVVTAADGIDALRILEGEDAPDLAILDWMMPGMDGPQVCESVRARPSRPYVYVLLLTARSQKDDILRGLESGADDYLTKPFHAAELRARVQVGQRILELQTGLISAREELLFRATHDELTGLVNRRVLIEAIAREHSRHTREGTNFAIVLMDLDHFKNVNDTYGHLAGDAVLKEVARRVAGCLRPYDTVGRYGGEEFVVVLPTCDRSGSVVVSDRILTSLNSKPIETAQGGLLVTASCGIAVSNSDHPVGPQTLLHLADEALYRAKANGRNRAEFAADAELLKSH